MSSSNNRSFVALQDPTVSEKCLGRLLQVMFHINMIRLSRLPSCLRSGSNQLATMQWPNHVRTKRFSTYDFANDRMSSAKRRSSKAGWPSSKSNPFKRESRLQLFIAHQSTAEKKRGLRTHPCPHARSYGKIAPRFPIATHFSGLAHIQFRQHRYHVIWPLHKDSSCIQSNASKRSNPPKKRTNQVGIPCVVVFSKCNLTVERNPCCLPWSRVLSICSMRPGSKYAKTIRSIRAFSNPLELTCMHSTEFFRNIRTLPVSNAAL